VTITDVSNPGRLATNSVLRRFGQFGVAALLAATGCAVAGENVHLEVSPVVETYDRPFDTKVTGLRPGELVTLRVTSSDANGAL
jgi:hypothetical protein